MMTPKDWLELFYVAVACFVGLRLMMAAIDRWEE